MAVRHPSAIKRHRQSLKRQVRNHAVLAEMRGELRKVRAAAASKEEDVTEQLRAAVKTISKAASKGVIHRNTAARHVARLSKRVRAATSA